MKEYEIFIKRAREHTINVANRKVEGAIFVKAMPYRDRISILHTIAAKVHMSGEREITAETITSILAVDTLCGESVEQKMDIGENTIALGSSEIDVRENEM